mmetsp:Transcript_10267/g.41547  ORF Transcript_10267/g.41547 Transcript_10267/m.41547 type:complete len:303 (-) Transcript_10267:4-912(-)
MILVCCCVETRALLRVGVDLRRRSSRLRSTCCCHRRRRRLVFRRRIGRFFPRRERRVGARVVVGVDVVTRCDRRHAVGAKSAPQRSEQLFGPHRRDRVARLGARLRARGGGGDDDAGLAPRVGGPELDAAPHADGFPEGELLAGRLAVRAVDPHVEARRQGSDERFEAQRLGHDGRLLARVRAPEDGHHHHVVRAAARGSVGPLVGACDLAAALAPKVGAPAAGERRLAPLLRARRRRRVLLCVLLGTTWTTTRSSLGGGALFARLALLLGLLLRQPALGLPLAGFGLLGPLPLAPRLLVRG